MALKGSKRQIVELQSEAARGKKLFANNFILHLGGATVYGRAEAANRVLRPNTRTEYQNSLGINNNNNYYMWTYIAHVSTN